MPLQVVDMRYMLFIFLGLLLCVPLSAADEPGITVSMGCFQDPSGTLGPEDVLRQEHFTPKTNDLVLPLKKGAYWFKITICNRTGHPTKQIIYENEDIFTTATFYRVDSKGTILDRYASGVGVTPVERRIENFRPAYPVTVAPGTCTTVLLKTVTHLSYLWPFVQSVQSFRATNNVVSLFYSFYFGVAFALILFNLFIYIFYRDRVYLYYILYLFVFNLWMVHQSGITHYFLSGNAILFAYIVVSLSFASFMLFTKQLLQNDIRTATFRRFTGGYIVFALLIAIIFIFSPQLATVLFSNVTMVTLPLLAVYLLFHGSVQTKMYLVALVIYLTALTISMLTLSGDVPYTLITRNLHPAGAMIEMILFSVILANRMNLLKREKLAVQQEMLTLQSEQNVLLEHKVEEQTRSLTLLFQELHHRVKNNFQLILTFLWVKKKSLADPQAIEAFEITEKRIHAIAQLHELLYANDATQVSFKTYVRSFLSSFKTERPDVTIVDDVDDASFTFDTAVTMGLILNELMINSFKHAFGDTVSPKIVITLKKIEGSQYLLSFSDNGKGFDAKSLATHDGLGYELMYELVRKLNHASLALDSSDGVAVTIRFSCEANNA
jgi:two-component system, sensor histidine kinase LadS